MAAGPVTRSWPARRIVAGIGAGAGAGALGLYGVQAVRYRRSAGRRFDVVGVPQPGTPEFSRLLEAMTTAPLRGGNRVKVMRNGRTLVGMIEAISSAKTTIDLSSYIYWPGRTADDFTAALVERARSGVDVNVVIDAYGSAKLHRGHLDRLKDAGATVNMFRPPRWYTLDKMNNRMHRRLLIVDGTVGFAGGVGIADVWTGDAEDPEHWRETHLRIEGPALLDVFGAFAENWVEATDEIAGGRHVPEPHRGFDDGVGVQVTRGTPTGGPTGTTQLFFMAIAGARRRLWLTTAYFAPDPAFEDVLCAAAGRGVDVRILVNGQKVDKEVARQAGQRSYAKLAEAGARIFEYDRTMLHAKVLLVDDEWANIGSSNFDSRSFDHDLEVNVSVIDAGIVSELEADFLDDVESSSEFDLDLWRKRPLRKRVGEALAGLTRQSL
ncbi:MAG: phospholipase D-like domain-containing protein [Acidimicrobiales bacterium]